MSEWIYYHNPHCSKSREGKELLERHQVPFTIKEYLKEPLEVSEVERLFELLALDPPQMIRTKESRFQELGPPQRLEGTVQPTRGEWARIIVENPILLERPILAGPTWAVIGRPPEQLLQMLPHME